MTAPVPPSGDLIASVDQIREDLGVSITALAVAVGVSQPTMSRLLNGQLKRPDPRIIASALVYLGRLMERRAAVA